MNVVNVRSTSYTRDDNLQGALAPQRIWRTSQEGIVSSTPQEPAHAEQTVLPKLLAAIVVHEEVLVPVPLSKHMSLSKAGETTQCQRIASRAHKHCIQQQSDQYVNLIKVTVN